MSKHQRSWRGMLAATTICSSILLHPVRISAQESPSAQENRVAGEMDSAASRVVPVWPDGPPQWAVPEGAERDTSTEKSNQIAGRPLIRLTDVREVELHVFDAVDDQGVPSPTTVVICPGGGFSILAWDLEGLEIAKQLQAFGVSAAVLKYRVPTRKMEVPWKPVVQDIQRAVAMVRGGAVMAGPVAHVGVMGFSAGGKACAHALTNQQRQYAPVDQFDNAGGSSETVQPPDFGCLVYPAWIVQDDSPHELRDGIEVDRQTPPMFFAHADNDPHQVLNSVVLFEKLHAAKVPAALHVFTGSGHGFGARDDGRADDLWPELFYRWIRDNGWIGLSQQNNRGQQNDRGQQNQQGQRGQP